MKVFLSVFGKIWDKKAATERLCPMELDEDKTLP